MLKQSRRQRLGISAVAPSHKRFPSVFLSECFRYILHMLLMFRVKHESCFLAFHVPTFCFHFSEVGSAQQFFESFIVCASHQEHFLNQ